MIIALRNYVWLKVLETVALKEEKKIFFLSFTQKNSKERQFRACMAALQASGTQAFSVFCPSSLALAFCVQGPKRLLGH